jgi:predicted ATP-grasp superfamily ATP-dependent carboligase
MHILVYEYLTGGGRNGDPSASLMREGERMVMALVRDLLSIPGQTVSLLRDARLACFPLQDERLQLIWVQPDEEPQECMVRALAAVDAVWPVAPETQGCLAALCQCIEAKGKRLLTTPSKGVILASSKGKTLQILEQYGVPVVPTRPWESLGLDENWDYPWVFKIDDGVGCEDTIIIHGPEERSHFAENPRQKTWLAQPLLEGEALSLSGVFLGGEGRLLCCNRQNIQQSQNGFKLVGMTVNVQPDPQGIFEELLSQVAQALPSLWGFAGIDLILGPQGPKVLEVNPRLTSAYPGIRPATGYNPAALVLELDQNQRLPSLPETGPGIPVELDWSHD